MNEDLRTSEFFCQRSEEKVDAFDLLRQYCMSRDELDAAIKRYESDPLFQKPFVEMKARVVTAGAWGWSSLASGPVDESLSPVANTIQNRSSEAK